MKMKTFFYFLLGAVFICLPVYSFSASNVIKIGVSGPFTGDQGKFGQDQLNGVKLAVEEWNSRGGLLGKKIELVEGDDQHDPKQAVAIAHKFVNAGVAGVLGHFNSSCSIPASQIYYDGKVVQITHGSTNPKLTEQGFDTVFRTCGRDDQQGKVAANFAIKTLKAKNIVILHDKTTYGQGLASEFKKGVEKGGIKVALYEGIVQGDKDFSSVLTKVKAKNPDLIFFGGIYVEGGLLIKQWKGLGGKAPFMGGDGILEKEMITIGGKAAEGTYGTFGPDPLKIPAAKGFNVKYKKRFGEPGPYSVYAYEAANVLFKGIQKAGTTDGKKVAQAIRGTEHKGALGIIKYGNKGDVMVSPYVVWQVKNGNWVQITK